jgi:hypothetical protein
VRFSKEEEEQRERVSSFEKKERQTEPIFLRTETGNYCQSSITLSGKKRERERGREIPRALTRRRLKKRRANAKKNE